MTVDKKISRLLQKGIDKGHFPGVSYCIVYKEGIYVADVLGYKQTQPTTIQNTKETIYDCASLTKVVSTTTMIFKLIEDGRLTLDTTISSVLPRFKHNDITIAHCLTHSSGLPADIPHAKSLRNRLDVEDRVYSFDLINPIGKKIVYSDIGFILLGWVIETITNKTLNTFAEEVIYSKLGMNSTSYHPPIERCAPTELREDDVYQGYLQGFVHDEKAFALGGESGHAGMFSDIFDLSGFIYSLLTNDGRVLKPETVDLLFPARIEDISPKGNRLVRSYGWDKPTKGGTAGDYVDFDQTIVHTGFTGCNMWIDRYHGVGFVMLSNAVHPKRHKNQIIQYRNQIGNIILSKTE
jgi:CubicO group peptidase (beta-lactamase class C family)